MTGASASLLLAVSPALPSAMSRPVWSLEDYTISRRLYKGSSSSVYKATCSRSGLPVALKVYFLNRLPGNCFHMLKREIEVHVQLAHTHIARLYGAFVERGVPGSSTPSTKVVLVQEYAARGDLFDLHERLGGRMKPAHVATLILKPLLEALSHMHSHGILHRDIKPANVLFTTDWRLLVADFGVSINLHHERAVTRAGTEGYMAPEVERCPLKADPQENKDKPQLAYSTAVDIWAVGCMAYELMDDAPRRSKLPWVQLKGFFSKLNLRPSTKVASEPNSPIGTAPGGWRLWEGRHQPRTCRSPGAPSVTGVASDCSGEDSGRLIVLDGSTACDSPDLFQKRSSSFGPSSLPPMAGQLAPHSQKLRHHALPRRNLSHLSTTTTRHGSWDGRGAAVIASPPALGAGASGPASPAAGHPAMAPPAASRPPPSHQSHLAASLARSAASLRGGSRNALPALTAELTSPLASPLGHQRSGGAAPSILESAASPLAAAAHAPAVIPQHTPARHHAAGSLWREPPSPELRSHSSNLETLNSALTAMGRAGGQSAGAGAEGAAFSNRRARSSGCDPAAISAGAPAASTSALLLAVSPALPSAMSRPVWSLEDYTISRRLYKGSSSAVYKAICARSGLPVALKVYFLNRLPGNCVHMLKREIQIHTQLVHKHVARLYGAFLERGVPGSTAPSTKVVLVQEYATRGDLFEVKQKLGGRIKPPQVATLILKPLLEALSHMHSHGILHRDIKPANVLFTTDWRLLVADFGVSINLHHERAVTRAGTEGYMAPEVERCPLKADPQENKDKPQLAYSIAVDIWAVGCMAYELMVGFPPAIAPAAQQHTTAGMPEEDAHGADRVQGCGGRTPLSLQFPATVPHEARDFICAALAPDPRTRPTAAQLLASEWLQGTGTDAGTDAGTGARMNAAPAGDVPLPT
ncbi:hypothetical protein HXX76_007916 [Chlamydomonas incerta]|uniref:Protein kinase domain-containing protein n=1 Tax=Chlamydomonas incerta TaxID=51695 RepID=A0A835T853_CHLIN|nr:hypothetical protein HXX76_007916 [Chlamydomonas incerta]|eukprot:KAG2434190.1 hypothetical protein HXX76_007916 [Chlamydomonas incerta]